MSKSSSNQPVVPTAREALNKFKMEAAQQIGVNLKQGYNGDLTSKEAGSVGGQMVNNVCPVRTKTYRRELRSLAGHGFEVTYQYGLRL